MERAARARRFPCTWFAAVLLTLASSAGAQERAVVTGRVLDESTRGPIAGALVSVEGTNLVVRSDAEGRYRLARVPAGPQVLRARLIGYAPARVSVVASLDRVLERDIMLSASPLMLEELVVTADAVGRARGELGTATVIETEAIRHQTAASLAGVLELVPGVPVQPPGLDDVQQIPLRAAPTSGTNVRSGAAGTDDLAAFGTLIILDGVPLSNNANLQTLGPRGELVFSTSAGGGIDLRQIPASTIERVEVIRGVPSARYGDLTQGAIVVDTRAGEVAPDLGFRYDARTSEGSLVAGRELGARHAITATFDLARTRVSPGLTEDASSRLAAQLSHRMALGQAAGDRGVGGRVTLNTRLDVFQLIDDRPGNPNVLGATRESRDLGLRISERARMGLGERAALTLDASYAAFDQRMLLTAPRTIGGTPITDRLTEGRSIGQYVLGAYTTEVTIDGGPRLMYGRFEADMRPAWAGLAHRLRAGVELRREWNAGAGFEFDIVRPPQVDFNGVQGFDRPRPYDVIPPLVTSALYADHRVGAHLGRIALGLQAGLRIDGLHDGRHWLSALRDAALQPRLNLEVAPLSWLRFRGGWGRTAKAPSLAQLFPAPQYFDVVNVNWFTDDPAERLAVLTTFIRDPTNADLGLVRATKTEVGVEVGGARWAMSVVAFRDRIDGGIGIHKIPSFVLRDRYDLSDSTTGTGQPPEIIEPPTGADTMPILLDRPDNIHTQATEGIELTAHLPEIPWLSTRLQVSGAWVRTEQTTDALYYGSNFAFSQFQVFAADPRTPYWNSVTETGKRVLVQYRLVHHQPTVGLVLTAIIQHNISDEVQDLGGTDTLAFEGYLTRDARHVPVPREERGRDEFRDLRVPRAGTVRLLRAVGQDWLMSVQLSKTLPLDGRLSFWAFNLFDRQGRFFEFEVQPRRYPPMRFGAELTLALRAFTSWLD